MNFFINEVSLLSSALLANDNVILLASNDVITTRYILINGEIIEIDKQIDNLITIKRRQVFGTSTKTHNPGTKVYKVSNASGNFNVTIEGNDGLQVCNHQGSGCVVSFILEAMPSDESNEYLYSWEISDATNYQIVGSNDQKQVTINSAPGIALLPESTVSVLVIDNSSGVSVKVSTTIQADKFNTIIPAVVNITGDTGILVCDHNGPLIGCFSDFNLALDILEGSGNFEYLWELSDESNYSFTTPTNLNAVTVRSANGTVDLPTTLVSVTVTDTTAGYVSYDSTTIKSNKNDILIRHSIVINGDTGTQYCQYSGPLQSCYVDFNLGSVVSNGSGNFTYQWEVPDIANYEIIGSSTNESVLIRSIDGTTDLPESVVTLTVIDTTSGYIENEEVTIKANKVDIITPPTVEIFGNFGTQSCNYADQSCFVEFNLSSAISNGLGNFLYQWTIFNDTDYEIIGSSTESSVVIRSMPSKTDTEETTVTLDITDVGTGYTASDSVPIEAIKIINDVPALIYETSAAAQTKMDAYTPPTIEDIFDTWDRFAGNEYFPGGIGATGDAAAWQLLQNPTRINQPLNTATFTGFISPDKYKDYVIETELTASGSDDDLIGLCIGYMFDTTSKSISLVRTGGGVGIQNAGTSANWGFYIQGISVSSNVMPSGLIGTIGGWNNRKTKVRIERSGNIITAQCTDFYTGETAPEYDAGSFISINLEDYPEFSMFYNEANYGYVSFSQTNSTYLGTTFEGGLDLNKVYDVELNRVYQYDTEGFDSSFVGWDSAAYDSPWVLLNDSIQTDLGFPIYATNPETNETFFIEQAQITKVV